MNGSGDTKVTAIDLSGPWLLTVANGAEKIPREFVSVLEPTEASVPGCVHTDLLTAQKIPDPFYGLNESMLQWIDKVTWKYSRNFRLTEADLQVDRLELVLGGLDTLATVTINDEEVIRTENMFLQHRAEVGSFVHPGENKIEIVFDAPIPKALERQNELGELLMDYTSERGYLRKAQYHFGWDWGPRLVTSGIWRAIRIEPRRIARIVYCVVRVTRIEHDRALLAIEVELERYSNRQLALQVDVSLEEKIVLSKLVNSSDQQKFEIEIRNPELWWPVGLGRQPLYTANVRLLNNGGEVDLCQTRFGIRTIRLLQEVDEEGKGFVFAVNGERFFCKGANWIPADSFTSRIDKSHYVRLLEMARDANMNMLRVWGGGIYEEDLFYDLCDQLGLLVWQDFMFACGEYPENDTFLQSVREEVTQNVKRLRNHPCIALWCGNNENEWIWHARTGRSIHEMRGEIIGRELIPETLKTIDSTRPYWRSSPFGDGHPNANDNGNHHEWEIWMRWLDYPGYKKVNARFVAEFGFLSPTNAKTFREACPDDEWHPQSRIAEHHIKRVEGQEHLYRFLAAHHRVTDDFDDFIYKCQIVQAEAMKSAVECWRRRKFKTAGALFWQFNDCWQGASWSCVDYRLRPKALYYFSKRFFNPVLLSLVIEEDSSLQVWVVNDCRTRVQGDISLSMRDFSGNKLGELRFECSVEANESTHLGTFQLQDIGMQDISQNYLVGELQHDDRIISQAVEFFTEPKHLGLPIPKIDMQVYPKNRLEISSDVVARYVFIDAPSKYLILSDNFFDLLPGDKRVVAIESDSEVADDDLTVYHLNCKEEHSLSDVGGSSPSLLTGRRLCR